MGSVDLDSKSQDCDRKLNILVSLSGVERDPREPVRDERRRWILSNPLDTWTFVESTRDTESNRRPSRADLIEALNRSKWETQ